jgi:MYXO-CTERM domain-containing protein
MIPTVMAESIMPLGASPAACPEPPVDAGVDASADAGVDSGTIPPPDDEGCGCTTPGSGRGAEVPLFAAGLMLLLALRRRRHH